MLAYTSLNHTLDIIGKSSNNQDVWNTLFSFMAMCRIEALTYHHQPPPGSADFDQSPLIVKKYFNRRGKGRADMFDHIFDLALLSKKDDEPTERFWAYTPEDLKALFKQNPDVTIIDIDEDIQGVSFPVHGPLGRSGYFSLIFGKGGGGSIEEKARVLKWACQNTHQVICKIQLSEFEEKIGLTEREKEILSWVARGKSNTVIADILGISHHTVNTYVRRIFLKTGKTDRTSVALLGLYQGLINL